MTTSVTLVRVFDRSWAEWRRGLRDCQKSPTRGAVHRLRVDARRLQALLDVLGRVTEAPPKPLRRLARLAAKPLDALTQLRDDQVQKRRIASAPDGRGLEGLLHHVKRRETRHDKRARQKLGQVDTEHTDAVARRVRKGVVRRQGARTPEERTLLLLTAVDAAATDLRSRLARLEPHTPRSLHKMRIALKHFRYIAEIAEEVSPRIHVASQPTLRSLQRRLGLVHDADVLLARIGRFAGRKRRHGQDVRAFKAAVERDRAQQLRGLSRALPALRDALSELAARASSGTVARVS